MKHTSFRQEKVASLAEPEAVEPASAVERPSYVPLQVELHRKQDKALVIAANALFFFGVFLFFFTFSKTGESIVSHGTGASIAGLVVLLSIVLHSVGRFLMWWHNG